MDSHKYTDPNFIKHQHKFRGLVSNFKSHKFTKKKTSHPASIFRSAITELFLDVRVSLRSNQYSDFLEWVDHQTNMLLPDLANMPVGFDNLSGVITSAPKASLGLELRWVTERIKVATIAINTFRSKAEEIERLVFMGDFETAIDRIKTIEDKFGASIWAIQLRIALEHQAGGLERQKLYSSKVRSVFRRGLLSFIGFYTSVRNEKNTTLAKYIEGVKKRLDKHKYYDSATKTYLNYRLAHEFPISAAGVADIIRVEQSHSLIDLYETFISVIQEIVRSNNLSKYREHAIKCLHSLNEIKDFRIAKALLVIEGSTQNTILDKRDTKLSDALFSGKVKEAAFIARHLIKTESQVDPWFLVYTGFAFGHGTRDRFLEYGRPQDIPCLIGRVLSRSNASFETLAVLSKLVANFEGLPAAVSIIDFIKHIQRSYPDSEYRPWLIGLNSSSIGIEDYSPKAFLSCQDWVAPSKKNTITITAWRNFHRPMSVTVINTSKNINLFSAAGMVRDGLYQKVIDLISIDNIEQMKEPVRLVATSIMLHAYFAMDDRQNVISLIADEGSRSKAHRQLLPIRSALESFQWDDYKVLLLPLTAPVALHLLWSKNESSITASLLRFAIRKLLNDPKIERPSNLEKYVKNYPKHQLIYFLRKVCVTDFMDHVRAIKGTRMLMEERLKVCVSLRFLDPMNEDKYKEEITLITHQQLMDEGQWIVDRSRIHVDVDALKRWATRELSEGFNRYRDLLDVDIGSSLKLDDFFKELMTESVAKEKPFVPETEADAILVIILRQLSHEFLNNSSFGLDFYLSKRIRHQSFIGLIRGPVEFANLITTRETEAGGYHRNEEWIGKFVGTNAETKEAINDAFTKFATKFDDTLTAAKENSFQIYSPDKPNGLVSLNLSPQIIFLLRSITQSDERLSDFINTVVSILWAGVEPSLTAVRQLINKDIKIQIAGAFDELRASVAKRVSHEDVAFQEFDMVIGKCSADVQAQLDVSSQWFMRTADVDSIGVDREFELEQMVNIAIEIALKCQRVFNPKVHIEVIDGDTQMDASTLVFLHDVMFVALDNIRAYSGLKKPKVSVIALVDPEEEIFKLEVCNESKKQNRVETEKKLKEIRKLIDARSFGRRTRSEGGSGFLKLAAVVHQSTKGRIDFGYNESGEFQLTVVYSLIAQSIPLENSNG